jgi:HK97 family phage major capsid protein
MSNTAVLDRLRSERDQARDAAIALVESNEYDPEASDALSSLEERAQSLDTQIERLSSLIQQQEAADALDGKLTKASRRSDEDRGSSGIERLTWGEAFVRSEQFTNYKGRGTSAQFELDTGRWQERALPTGITDLIAGGLTSAKTTMQVQPPAPPTPLLDNVSQVQVTGNAVEFVVWAKKAGGAAVVPEKGVKPSIEYGPTVTSDTLDTIAGYTKLTRQLIEDFASVRDYIDGELRREVYMKEEAEAVAALNAAAPGIEDVEGEDLLAAIRVGIATVQSKGYNPTAVMLNPADWAALDNAVMGATLIGPQVRQTYWGLTVIPSATQPEGGALVGDFRTAITHFYRSQIALFATDSDASDFLANVFTLLAERRSLTAVVRPQALADCSATVVP